MPKPLSTEKKLEWKEKIQTQQQSGLSIKRWCQEHQITPQAFHYWKDRLFPKASITKCSFQEIINPSIAPGITIECQGIRILLEKNFDPTALAECLQILKKLPC